MCCRHHNAQYKWPLLLAIGAIPDSDGNAQVPAKLVSTYTLPLLPQIALMASGRDCFPGALRCLQYLLCLPLAIILQGSHFVHTCWMQFLATLVSSTLGSGTAANVGRSHNIGLIHVAPLYRH